MKMVGKNQQSESNFLQNKFPKEKLMHPNSTSQVSIIVAYVKSSPPHFKTKLRKLSITPHSVSFGSLLRTVPPSIFIRKSTIPMLSSRSIKRSWNYLFQKGNNMNTPSQCSCSAQT